MFEPSQWMLKCERISVESVRGAGASYDVYVERFNERIRIEMQNVDHGDRAAAIEIARQFGYMTVEEIETNRHEVLDSGACAHGIDLAACPEGCNDR